MFTWSAVNGTLDVKKDDIIVEFLTTTNGGDVNMSVIIPFVNDDTIEAEEGFYLVMTVYSRADFNVHRNGVALVRIEDDDSKVVLILI